jgi:uncharacterized damage-inducible protein DinB
MITRKDISVPEFYKGYINSVKEDDMMEALANNTRQFRKFLKHIPGKKINYAYAEGKWTVKELLQHMIDAERVFCYRALSFARKDSAPLPSFDENVWAITAKAPKRKWNDLVDEFKALRAANIAFFASLDEEQLQQTGTANNNVMSVAALGFVCAGHVAHHMRIIRERYLDTDKKEEKIKETKPKEEKPKAEKVKSPKEEKVKKEKPKAEKVKGKVKKNKKAKKLAEGKFKKQKKPLK